MAYSTDKLFLNTVQVQVLYRLLVRWMTLLGLQVVVLHTSGYSLYIPTDSHQERTAVVSTELRLMGYVVCGPSDLKVGH